MICLGMLAIETRLDSATPHSKCNIPVGFLQFVQIAFRVLILTSSEVLFNFE